jgi:hypothetical protein
MKHSEVRDANRTHNTRQQHKRQRKIHEKQKKNPKKVKVI